MIEAKTVVIKSNIWLKTTAIFCLIALLAAALIAWNNPAKGYELNIYASTPSLFWILIIVSFIGGTSICLFQIFSKDHRTSRLWLIGLTILIISRMVLLYLPYIRGYVSWSGDNIRYLGMIKDIIYDGYFTNNNFYPITHIFLSNIINISKISDSIVANLSTAYISIVFIISTYLLAGIITHNKRIQLLAVVIGGSVMLTNIYNVILAPNGWSLFFLPLLFYFYFNQDRIQYRILFYVLLIMYPFIHPLSSLMVVISLGILELIKAYFIKNKSTNNVGLVSLPIGICAIVEFIIFVSWVWAYHNFDANIRIMWQQVTTREVSGKLAELGASINKINIHGLDFVLLLLKMFGAEIILLVLSIIGILWIFKQIKQGKRYIEMQHLFALESIYIVCGLFYGAYLLGLPGFSSLGEGQVDRRFLGYLDVLIPIFASLSIFLLLEINRTKTLIRFSIAGLIIISSVLSIASLYFSPYIKQPNPQITRTDMSGAQWFIDRKSPNIYSVYMVSDISYFIEGIIGLKATRAGETFSNNVKLPDHFDYTTHDNLGIRYEKDKYLVVPKSDTIIYSTVWKEVGRFLDEDFEHLEHDFSVNSLYSNGKLNIYYIRSLVLK